MSEHTESLYERLGGEETIARLVPAFYIRVFADPELAPFFENTSLEKLHLMQHAFFVMATGGPTEYTGRSLAHVHHGLGITADHFSRFTGHLLDSLLDLGTTQEEADEVIQRINLSANEILGVSY